jgi:ankyrin repeat protein
VHVSRIQSLSLDQLSSGRQALLQELGNKRVNALLEAGFSGPRPATRPDRERFATSKYVELAFARPAHARDADLLGAAAKGDALGVLAALILAKVDVNECLDADGNSALHLAAKHDKLAAFTLLIERGANLGLANKSGLLCADLAGPAVLKEVAVLKEAAGGGGSKPPPPLPPNKPVVAVGAAVVVEQQQLQELQEAEL